MSRSFYLKLNNTKRIIKNLIFFYDSIEKRPLFEWVTPSRSQIVFGNAIVKEIVFRKYLFSSIKRNQSKTFIKIAFPNTIWERAVL